MGAPAEQLQHLEAALALWTAVPDAEQRAGRDLAALLFETASTARTVGELHRAVALLRSAQESLGDDADPAVRARLHYTLAQTMVRVEDLAGAHRESSAAMALVPADPPSEVRTWAAATHARMSYSVGRLAEGDAAAEEALAAADALGLDSAWSDTAVSQVRSRQDTDAAAVEQRLDEALRRARRSGDVDVEMRVLFNRATLAFEAGRIAESLEWTRRATARARDLGMEWAFYPAELRHLQVTALYMAGDWDESLAEADLLARVPEMAAHVRAAGLLVLVGRGDPAARERLAWARSLIPRLNAHVLLSMVTAAAEVDLAAWAGDARHRRRGGRVDVPPAEGAVGGRPPRRAAAGRDGARCARGRRRGGTRWSPTRPRWSAGRPRGSRWSTSRARRSPSSRRRSGEMGVEGTAWAARVEAEAARLLGKPAPELWRAAVEAFGFGHVYEEARSRWRLAEALLGVRRPGRRRGGGARGASGRRAAGRGAAARRPSRRWRGAAGSTSAWPVRPVRGRLRRPDAAGGRGTGAARAGPDQPADRRGALHQREDGERARQQHHRQARRQRPHRSGRDRRPARHVA